jgi:hypothetical protein
MPATGPSCSTWAISDSGTLSCSSPSVPRKHNNQAAFEYRLADLVARTEWQNPHVRARVYRELTGSFDGLARYTLEHFPESLGASFVRMLDRGHGRACAASPNFSERKVNCTADLCARMLLDWEHRQERKSVALVRPASSMLVVHLRLGDVLDAPQRYPPNRSKAWAHSTTVGDIISNWHRVPSMTADNWLDGGGVANEMFGGAMRYLHPRSFYEKLDLPRTVTHAVVLGNTKFMMGGSTRSVPLPAPISSAYARGVVRTLSERGLATTLRLDGEADADFAFMARAKHFARSGGGYSTLIAHVVQRHGGCVHPGLDQTDYMSPHEVAAAKSKRRQQQRPTADGTSKRDKDSALSPVTFYPPGDWR